jgi:ferrous iron transport protein A
LRNDVRSQYWPWIRGWSDVRAETFQELDPQYQRVSPSIYARKPAWIKRIRCGSLWLGRRELPNKNDSHYNRANSSANRAMPANPAFDTLFLDQTPLHASHVVQRVTAPQAAPDLAQRLEEIGFIAGERVAVVARGFPGGNPLMVRVGASTFALRREEAACISVRPIAAAAPALAGTVAAE